MGPARIRDQTCVPYINRLILNHWPTSEALWSLPPVLINVLPLANRGDDTYLRILVGIKCLLRPITAQKGSSRVRLDMEGGEFGFCCSQAHLDTLPAGGQQHGGGC